jgi:transcriptional regulator with XRE-family HTH domain
LTVARPDPRAPRCGRFLSELRRRQGLSQKELAERTGIEQTNISRIERDKVSPTLFTLNRLLEGMGSTLQIAATPLSEPPPGGGNAPIGELRADYVGLTPDQQLEQAVILTRVASELGERR